MRNNAGEKVRNIIREECDNRMEIAVVTYILDRGWDNVKKITKEQILRIDGNGFMTKEFCQALVRAAVRICTECEQIGEFLPFIVNYLYVPNAKMREIEIYKDEVRRDEWENLLEKFDLEYEEDIDDVDMLVLNANVINTVKFE